MSLYKKLSALSVVGLFALTIFAIPFAFAQDATNGGGSGLLVSPTRTEMSAQPGEQKKFKVTIKNVTGGDVTAQAFVNDFRSDGESGSPQIIVDENEEPSPYSLKDAISGLEDISLKPDESKEVEYTVEMPADATPGAYFGAIRYAAIPAGQETSDQPQVSLTASVAHLVFVEVPGEVVQQIQIENVEVLNSDGSAVSFFQNPSDARVTIKNLGNGFARPFGKVSLTRGGSEVYSYDLNNTDPRGIILPQSTRKFTDPLSNVSTPGQYKITAAIAYGNGGEVVTYEKSFWYLPIWFLAAVAGVIILLVAGGVLAYKKYTAKKFGK